MRKAAVAALCLFLAGCLGPPKPSPVTVVGCPYIVPHDKAFQSKLGTDYLVASPELQTVTKEWLSLRDQARACREASK